jgi:hypothetical protein
MLFSCLYERSIYMHIKLRQKHASTWHTYNTFCSLIYRVHMLLSMLICILVGVCGLTDVDEVARNTISNVKSKLQVYV